MTKKPSDALKAPNPFRGWASEIEHLKSAVVMPPETRSFHQPAGVLRADGSYCSAQDPRVLAGLGNAQKVTGVQVIWPDGSRDRYFQDHLEDGRMAFDFRLQPGVVEKSNALELMRAVGLDV